MTTRSAFLFLNVLGGSAVLGSYVWGIAGHPDLQTAFWGEVPLSMQGLYTGNMFLAAAGYIMAFCYFMGLAHQQINKGLLLAYAAILLPSAAWMPLTVATLETGSTAWWYLTRLDLLCVGAAGIYVFWRLSLSTTPAGKMRPLARVSFLFFILQTAVLDALIWPAYFVIPD